MAIWDDVAAITSGLPEVTVADREWRVKGKLFAWERPLRRSDMEALGSGAPEGPILAAWVPDLEAKEAMLASESGVFFTTPHFDGYRIVLILLDEIERDELEEVVVEAWLVRAPKRLADEYLAGEGR